MTRPGADVREAQSLEQLAYGALVILDPEPLFDDALKVDAPPAHHAIDGAIRAGFHDLGKFRLLRSRQPPGISPSAVVLQPGRAMRVEPVHPVPQRLPVHPANLRGLRPAHAVQHGRDRQQSPALVRILRRSRQTAKLRWRMARLDLDNSRHGAGPPRHLESRQPQIGNPRRVSLAGRWYNLRLMNSSSVTQTELFDAEAIHTATVNSLGLSDHSSALSNFCQAYGTKLMCRRALSKQRLT